MHFAKTEFTESDRLWRRFFFFLDKELVDGLEHKENAQRDDEEVEDGLDKHAVVERSNTGLFSCLQAGIGNIASELNKQIAEVDPL